MATEIATEVASGNIVGPFQAPADWPCPAVPLAAFTHTADLLPLPFQPRGTAVAFSIHQTGSDGQPKLRRGEDWRRSYHNSTILARDTPHHHTIDSYIALAMALGPAGTPLQLWGHDHEGAYRQLPLRHPDLAFLILFTSAGPTL